MTILESFLTKLRVTGAESVKNSRTKSTGCEKTDTAFSTLTKLDKINFKLFEHPLHSPNLSPLSSHLRER